MRVKWPARALIRLNWAGWTCAEDGLRAMSVLNGAKGAKVTLSCRPMAEECGVVAGAGKLVNPSLWALGAGVKTSHYYNTIYTPNCLHLTSGFVHNRELLGNRQKPGTLFTNVHCLSQMDTLRGIFHKPTPQEQVIPNTFYPY